MGSGENTYSELPSEVRRTLAKRLTSVLNNSAGVTGDSKRLSAGMKRARRLGFSGAPGAGKSSLIDAWARQLLQNGRRVGVLAVDPSSPISGGALLGDRIRMEHVTSHPAFYMRSVPSRRMHDGLCPRAAELLDVFDAFDFDDVMLETVGVGQTDYAARALVDTFVMVVGPENGDIVQAMKAGILEMADVLVINKADLAASARTAREMRSVIDLRSRNAWKPPVIEVSAEAGTGLDKLGEALEAHASLWSGAYAPERLRDRARYALLSGLTDDLEQEIASLPADQLSLPLTEIRARVIAALSRKG